MGNYQRLTDRFDKFWEAVDENPTTDAALNVLADVTGQIEDVYRESVDGKVWDSDVEDEVVTWILSDAIGERAKTNEVLVECLELENEGIVNGLLSYIEYRAMEAMDGHSKEDLQDIIKRLGIEYVEIDRVVLDPMDIEFQEGDGDADFERKELSVSKFKLLLNVLRDGGVYTNEIMVVEGKLLDGMMRERSYIVVDIPRLGVKIFLNEGYSEASFVLTGNVSWEDIYGKTKDEIVRDFGAKRAIFDERYIENWMARMSEDIFGANGELEEKSIAESKQNLVESLEVTGMGEAYFRDSDKVRADLEKYAKKAGKADPTHLSLAYRERVICSNGENVIFLTYLNRAGIALGIGNNRREVSMKGKRKEIFNCLLEIAGYELEEFEEMDEAYFKNPENMRADLKSYSEKAGRDNPVNLSASDNEQVVCNNGEGLTFGRYLTRAGVFLGIVTGSVDAQCKKRSILDKLLEIAGYELKEFEKMDEAYFMNAEKVQADLEKYADRLGKYDSIDLVTSGDERVICSNGENVLFQTYLYRAGVALGICDDSNESNGSRRKILDELLKIAGYELEEFEKMDEEYFMNAEKVREDLKKYSEKAGRDNPVNLSSSDNEQVICNNGEKLTFGRYLKRAGVFLGIATGSADAHSKKRSILDRLLEIAGYELEKFEKMDEAYFRDSDKVRADLEKYAKKAGKADPTHLSLAYRERVICSNGENVIFLTYLNRAGIALGIGNSRREVSNKSKRRETFNCLLKIAGYEVDEFKEMDEVYFRDSVKVKEDLEGYAEMSGEGDPTCLSASYKEQVICNSGEEVAFYTYLSRAGVALNIAKNSKEAMCSRREILNELLKIAGYEVKEFEEMDEMYFRNSVKVRADLEKYAEVAGKEDPTFLTIGFQERAICCNGENLRFWTYIFRVRKIFWIACGKTESEMTPREALNKLLEIAGYEVMEFEEMDEAYFMDSEKVRSDLEKFAEEFGKDDPTGLFMSDNGQVICSNGEGVKFLTYLSRAGVSLGLAVSNKETQSKRREILNKLLEVSGYL